MSAHIYPCDVEFNGGDCSCAETWKERAEKAESKAALYAQDWYDAKSEFGTAMAKARTRITELEKAQEDIAYYVDMALEDGDDPRHSLGHIGQIVRPTKPQ